MKSEMINCSKHEGLWECADFTSAGTLNFSTTPSSKKQRMPHLMSSNSDRGKSLKWNSCSSTVLGSGMLVFCVSLGRGRKNKIHQCSVPSLSV